MSAAPVETELKLRVPAAAVKQLLNDPVLRDGERAPAQKLKAIYFDTPKLDLHRRGAALRVRREGTLWIQTLKWAGSKRAGLHERSELEVEVAGPSPDLALVTHPEAVTLLHEAHATHDLQAVFETDINRIRRLIAMPDDSIVEASIDRGEIRCRGHAEAVSEIELELKRGSVRALFDVALRVVERAPATLENRSKAERGYSLFLGAPASPARATQPELHPGMSVSAAFAAVAWTTLEQLHANEAGVLQAADPEYLHQMRVGLRRLRSAVSVFGDALPEASRKPIAAELRWIGAMLGPARDWDVFVTETLPAIRRAFAEQGALEALAGSAHARQRRAQRRAHRAIRSRRYQRAMINVASWVAAEAWRSAADDDARALLDSPVRPYADTELERRYERVRRRGRKLGSLSPAERHELRIAIKKLRYAVDFFGALFDPGRVRLLRSRLSSLQDTLGSFNDAVGIHRLLDELHDAAPDAPRAEARGIVIGWAAGRTEGLDAELQRAWRAFRRTETFW